MHCNSTVGLALVYYSVVKKGKNFYSITVRSFFRNGLLYNAAHGLHEFDEVQLNQQFFETAEVPPMH